MCGQKLNNQKGKLVKSSTQKAELTKSLTGLKAQHFKVQHSRSTVKRESPAGTPPQTQTQTPVENEQGLVLTCCEQTDYCSVEEERR